MTMRNERPSALMGRSVPRLEDAKLLRGAGRFVDDIDLPDVLHATFVRSPVAHGLLQRVDADKARAMPGIGAVLTYADLRPVLACDRIPLALPVPALRFHVDPCVLARQEVHYVGEPVALVVADSRQQAEDAAALVELDVRPLPAVLEPRAGLEPGAPKARLDCPDNLVAHWVVEYGDVERAFAGAVHRTSEHFRIHKGGGHSIEARGVLARFDATDELLTVWDSTQMPHKTKRVLVEALGLSEERVRVIAPDVGGGFGPKNPFYPEELAVPAAALLLGRPIKWIEDRRECFTATNHEREQDWEIEAAVDREGKLLAIRGHLRHDHGATTPSGLSLPQNSATNLIGPYVLPAYRLEVSLCLTNLVAATSTRGAGRTQGTFVMKRMLDRICTNETQFFRDGRQFQFLDERGDGLVDAALQIHRVHAGGDRPAALTHDRLRQHDRSRGAVARNIVGLGRDLAYHLHAHVLELVGKLDLLGDSYAVLGDARRAIALVQDHIAPLRAERDPDRLGEDVHASHHALTGVTAGLT